METWINELRPYPGEGRWGSGWRLAKSAWRLLLTDRAARTLMLLQTLLLALVVTVRALVDSGLGLDGGARGAQLFAYAVVAFGSTFLMFALVRAADAAIDGMPLETGEALTEAREESGLILGWSLVLLAVALAFWLLVKAIGPAAVLVGVCWYFLSPFAIPAMATAGLRPGAALAESLRTLRWRWRPALAGLLGIATFALLAAAISGYLFTDAAASHNAGEGTDYPLIVAGFLLLSLVYSALVATRETFALILLREDLDDLPGEVYSGPRLRRRTKVLRFAGTCVAAIALLVAGSELTEEAREVNDASGAPGANYETLVPNPGDVELSRGDAVYYRELEIGTVLGSEPEGGQLRINFHVDPGYGPTETPGSFVVVGDVGARGQCPCLILVPEGGGGSDLQLS